MTRTVLEDVVQRLESFGYTASNLDCWVLQFVIEKVRSYIGNACNVPDVPDELHAVAVDRACGEFLFTKKAGGQLLDLEVEAAVKSIREGDTQVTYAVADDAVTLDGLIEALKSSGNSQLSAYRRLVW